MEQKDELTQRVIGCAMRVHSALGPGLLENAYEQCLAMELSEGGIAFKTQVNLPVTYRGRKIQAGYRIDVLVEERLILELKSVEVLLPLHKAQVLAYMKLANIPTGLLINFNTTSLRKGLHRLSL